MISYNSRFLQAITILNRYYGRELIYELGEGVTRTQLYMLLMIKERGKSRPTELAEKLDVKPSAVTVMIDRLEKAGYVARTYDQKDRRVILIELTDSGRHMLDRALEVRKEMVGKHLAQLSDDETKAVTEILEKMVQFISDDGQHGTGCGHGAKCKSTGEGTERK
ncbi:MarR family winged helix-turn-helix transcriptional regulator [Paenibacillus chungangensis]|uniref:MarR family winged helix-turn-helix transcriptional regulator n=1 Tax=Paenibacillus chungangensis TaxID=696535 RepID=A0ABW3HND4_9BACL